MKSAHTPAAATSRKAPTGIAGFDEISGGGLPRGRTTLLAGGPGSGKTIFSLQFLINGVRHYKEPGIFVAFEETSKRIRHNAVGVDLSLAKVPSRKLLFVEAQPHPEHVQIGDFDLCGMLATLTAQSAEMKARRIVFDALDIVLALLPDLAARRREVYRLHDWLLKHELTCLINSKAGTDEENSTFQHPYSFMEFMVDCSVVLNHTVV